MKRALTLALVALGALGCAGPVTEIVVVVDTELDVPTEMDGARVVIDADSFGGGTDQSVFMLRPGEPATLGVVHRGGPLGPIVVRVQGTLGADVVVHAGREVTFVPDRIMRLDVPLRRACQIPACPASQSCDDNGQCNPHPAGALRPWTGSAGALVEGDAGSP